MTLADDTWQQFRFEVPMLADVPSNIDRVKAYVWNANDAPIWIDDFSVQLLR